MMKKAVHIILTVLVMLVISRFAVRIVDATVQIDGNFLMLALFLITVNMIIGAISHKLYKRYYRS